MAETNNVDIASIMNMVATSLHMAETNNVDIASIMNMVATLSPEGSGARKDVIIEPAAPAPAPVSEPLHMAETNNVDIASIMNMVATLSPEGSGARKDVIIEPAAPAPAPVSEPAPSASPVRAATVRTLGSAGSLTADDVAEGPVAGRRAEASPEELAARHKRIVAALAVELGQPAARIQSVIDLIDEGATIPFIARYRKEATGGMDDVALRTLDDRLSYLRNLEQRKSDVIAVIDAQGKLTEELRASIEEAPTLQRVEDLYKPYRKKRAPRASKARDAGLEPLANLILMQPAQGEDPLTAAAEYVNVEGGFATAEAVPRRRRRLRVRAISLPSSWRRTPRTRRTCASTRIRRPPSSPRRSMRTKRRRTSPITSFPRRLVPFLTIASSPLTAAELVAEDPENTADLREYTHKTAAIESEAIDADEKTPYEPDYEFSEAARSIPNHRILAINRGEREGKLRVRVRVDGARASCACACAWTVRPRPSASRAATRVAVGRSHPSSTPPSPMVTSVSWPLRSSASCASTSPCAPRPTPSRSLPRTPRACCSSARCAVRV